MFLSSVSRVRTPRRMMWSARYPAFSPFSAGEELGEEFVEGARQGEKAHMFCVSVNLQGLVFV